MAEALNMSITADKMAELLQAGGYKAEKFQDSNGITQLRSGANGVGFNIRFGNPAPAPLDGYLDFSFLVLIKFDVPFPLERINRWNQDRRFTRLHRADDILVMDMDVVLAGGVGDDHLRGLLDLWDRLLQEFAGFLREDAGGAANAA